MVASHTPISLAWRSEEQQCPSDTNEMQGEPRQETGSYEVSDTGLQSQLTEGCDAGSTRDKPKQPTYKDICNKLEFSLEPTTQE